MDMAPSDSELEDSGSAISEIALDDANAGAPHAEIHAAGDEVDLSDEWEAMVQEVIEPTAPASAPVPAPVSDQSLPIEAAEPPAPAVVPASETETIGHLEAADSATEAAEPVAFEIAEESIEIPALDFSEVMPEVSSSADVLEADESFELDLTPEISEREDKGVVTAEQFLSELAAEVEGIEPLLLDEEVTQTTEAPVAQASTSIPVSSAEGQVVSEPFEEPGVTTENLNQLAEVFQEFRNEFGEIGEEDEDLETHYNLGIAYREMGLLEEAIGEFQKVAKAVQKGKPFRYAMNCATLLALTFRDKGEPKIASLWYRRALDVPGLDQETIMALRYDLGISLEMADEPDAALDCFRQVYATNIDYRDVADRIATLQHH